MLRICITAVSLLAVLTHVTVGCCLHHSHAAESSTEAASCLAGHHHPGESAPHDEGGPLPPHDDCHESHCFIALASPTSVPDNVDIACDVVNLAGSDEVARTATASAAGEILADASRPLPLRAHLRYCVLLN